MFNGYSDVVAYRRGSLSSYDEDDNYFGPVYYKGAENRVESSLPIDLEPPYPVPEPWWESTPKKLSSDFILLAEFCELQGPKPLICIPSNLKCSFDLNTFTVRILSVDYQISDSGNLPVDDTQVILPDVLPGIHAYAHYMTLSDINARGYVRTMCLAYVTTDKLKLTEHFLSIRNKFLNASNHLKYGSRTLFRNELECKLKDLLFTKGRYITHSTTCPIDETAQSLVKNDDEDDDKVSDDNRFLDSVTLESLQSYIEEVESALIKVNQLLIDDKDMESEAPSYSHVVVPLQVARFYVKALKFDERNRKVDYKPKLVRTTQATFSGELRNVFTLSGHHAAISIYVLYGVHKYYSPDSIQLYINTHRTVLPHMERLPSIEHQPSSNHHSVHFWDSVRIYDQSSFDDNVSRSSSDSSIGSSSVTSTSASSGDSCCDDDSPVSFSSSLEYLNSNMFSVIHSLREKAPGYGISEVFNRFPCIQHVVYSLLMSRLLIIVGNEESESTVRAVVQALRPLIVPFSCPALVIPWRKESLKVTDLGWIQLIGLCREDDKCPMSVIPESMKHYVSVLDVDKRIFVGPTYSGTFLQILDNKSKENVNDVCILSLVNSLIFDVVLKTRIYYYHQLEAENSLRNDVPPASIDSDNDKLFFRQMYNSASDVRIIKHLVEIMKMEVINKLKSRNDPSVDDRANKTAPVIRIQHERASIMKM
ncbi:SMCR8 (predicted) [Pycnogonum litorale]